MGDGADRQVSVVPTDLSATGGTEDPWGLDLALGTVTDGLKRLAPLFAPLREALRARSRTADHWHADETSWYVFEATGEDAGYRWCLWVFWCREAVVFKLDRTRSARVPKEHFAGVAGGTVSADRYASYKRLAKDTAVVIAYCWAHVRRDFIAVADQWEQHQEWAEEWLGRIAELYRLNKERLLVLSDPGQYAAAEAALRAAISAMQQCWERELAQPQLHHAPKKVLTSLRKPLVRADPVRRAPRYPDGQQPGRAGVARPGCRAQELLRFGGALER